MTRDTILLSSVQDANNSSLVQGTDAGSQGTDDSQSEVPLLRSITSADSSAADVVSQDITKLKELFSQRVNSLKSGGADFTEKTPHIDEEFICGWGAAFINITTTFPINKAIFRQQLHGISGFRALRQLKREGLRHLYRGLLPPLMQKTTSVSIMFGSYHKFKENLDARFPAVPVQVNHANAAMLAGTMEMSLTPFERIQSLLQNRVYQQRFRNSFHAARELWAYGFREYYRGSTCIFLRNGPSNVLFFLGREYLDDNVPDLEYGYSRVAKDFLCGACLGALISTAVFPLNVVKTHMQAEIGVPFYSVWGTFRVVWAERNQSVSNLFRGFHLNYTRSFISWGIINASYEVLLHYLRMRKDSANGSL